MIPSTCNRAVVLWAGYPAADKCLAISGSAEAFDENVAVSVERLIEASVTPSILSMTLSARLTQDAHVIFDNDSRCDVIIFKIQLFCILTFN